MKTGHGDIKTWKVRLAAEILRRENIASSESEELIKQPVVKRPESTNMAVS